MEIITSKEPETVNRIAFFDLDRTITGTVSGTEIARRAWKKGLMSLLNLLRALKLSAEYRLGVKDPAIAVYEMAAWVRGISERELEVLCSEVFQDKVLPFVFTRARDELKMHKDNNTRTVILSSSLQPICRETASHLGMDDIICSELEVSDGILTGRPAGKLCFGEEKLTRLKSYCEKNNSNPKDCWYYADSLSDLPALQEVGITVCVNPEKKLKAKANHNGRKIN
jgi:putative phosphoserine phosphatase/1-acylglycerol-3-phosphate O-acyltransferase